MPLSAALLQKQDDRTSEAVLDVLRGNSRFLALSDAEGKDIIERDRQDDVKLSVGIEISVAKGVLSPNPAVDPVQKIDVNGNVFRSFTHLISEVIDANGTALTAEVFTPELLSELSKRLTFQKFDDGFDVVIDGKVRVSSIQNTLLKMPHIGARVPTIAEQTQGEVIIFAAAAVDTLRKEGHNVILEGRAQTLNYIPSPHRFELVIADPATLGERRAAQRVMAKALESLGATISTASETDVQAAVLAAVDAL